MLRVEAGSLSFVHEAAPGTAIALEAGDSMVIAPGVAHHVEPADDARFHIEFHR